MGIKTKLILLISTVFVAALAAFGMYFILNKPIETARAELQEFEEIVEEYENLRLELAALFTLNADQQYETLQQKRVAAGQALAEIPNFIQLPKINDSVAQALLASTKIDNSINERWPSLEENMEKALDIAEEISRDEFGPAKKIKFIQLMSNDSVNAHSRAPELRRRFGQLVLAIESMDTNIESLILTASRQFEIIKQESEKSAVKAQLTAVLSGILILGLATLFAYRIAALIASIVAALATSLSVMKSGDLTVVFVKKSRDELGRLADDLNGFAKELRESIKSIQGFSLNNIKVKEELISTASEASASVNQINANTAFIAENLKLLTSTVGDVKGAVKIADNGIRTLEERLEGQAAMIEESTASVTQMIASIGAVASSTVKRQSAGKALVESAQKGGVRLDSTVSIIRDISSNVDEISGITKMIQNLAGKTNLLAMNAAIEAAHAGDAGRGFAIVADEIRNLAEASSSNSKRIAGVLKEVISKIEQAAEEGTGTKIVFSEMDEEVRSASDAFVEIAAAMDQLKAGGTQILEAMEELRRSSSEVKEGRDAIVSSSKKTAEAVDSVERISDEVLGSVSEIKSGMNDINSAVSNVAGISNQVGQAIVGLDQELQRFKTKAEKTENKEEESEAI